MAKPIETKWLEEQLVQVISEGLEAKEIEEEQASKIAQYVLTKIDKLNTPQEYMAFIKDLIAMHKGFAELATIIEGKFDRQHEITTAQKIAQLIKQGATKNAVQLAKSEMQ